MRYTFYVSMKSITERRSMIGDVDMSMKKGQHIFGTVKVGEKGKLLFQKKQDRSLILKQETPY